MRRTETAAVLGITGGVGSGKSTVLSYLKDRHQADVLELDKAAAMLQQPGGSCYEPMIRLLGDGIVRENGELDRALIAQQVFADPQLLLELNAIVHPKVRLYVQDWVREKKQQKDTRLMVLEAALLLEDSYDTICDEIWYVHADRDVRRQRLKTSRGYSDGRIDDLFARQKTDSWYRERCDLTVDNSREDPSHVFAQIDKGLKEHELL